MTSLMKKTIAPLLRATLPVALAALVMPLGALAPLTAAHAQVLEQWQSRMLEALDEMERIDAEFAPDRDRLSKQSRQYRERTASFKQDLEGALRLRSASCSSPTSAKCLDARASVEEAHLDMTEAVAMRLQTDRKIMTTSMAWSLRQSDVLVRALEHVPRSRREQPGVPDDPMATTARRVESFMAKAAPALRMAAKLAARADAVHEAQARQLDTLDPAAAARIRAKGQGAKQLLIAYKAFNARKNPTTGRTLDMAERLQRLQIQMTTFAALNRLAVQVIDENLQNVQVINALIASQLAADTVALFEGGFKDFGRAFRRDTTESLEEMNSDVHFLLDSIDGGIETPVTDADYDDDWDEL